MGKQISIDILDYIGTEQFSSALGTFYSLGTVTNTSGDAGASPITTPEPEALKSNFAVGTGWRGWYADGTGDYYVSTAAPTTSSGGQLKLPIAPADFTLLEALSACGVYTKLTNLEIGATYTVTVRISQSPASGVYGIDHLDVGSGINYNSGTAITQTNGTIIYPAFGNFGVGTFFSTGTHTVNLTAEHTSGYFSVTGYGNGTGDWIVDSVSISTVGSSLKKQVFGTLDITDSKNFPLAMSYTISDGKDLESRFGDFSKSFDIPATKNNNKLLNHIYNPLIKDDKNISGLKDCRIMVDGIVFFEGQIQVQGSKQTSRPQSYNATIYGGNFAWVSLLRDKNLCDLPISNTAHTFDYATITSSWTTTQATSDIVYPLVSCGDFYPTGAAGTVNLWDEDEIQQDWRGWFWVYNIIQEIFNTTGYQISSNIMSSSNFKKLITHFGWSYKGEQIQEEREAYRCEIEYTRGKALGGVPSCTSNPYIVRPSAVSCSEFATRSGTGWVSTNGGFSALTYDVVYNDAIHNPVGAYDTSTGNWTCPKTGFYKITAGINVTTSRDFGSTNNNSSWFFYSQYKIRKNGTTIVTADVTNPSGQAHFWGNQNFGDGLDQGFNATAQTNGFVQFTVGDVVDTRVSGWGDEGTALDPDVAFAMVGRGNNGYDLGVSTLWNPPIVKFEVEYDPQIVSIGDSFLPQVMLPCDTSQLDFLKAIAHMFNLYFSTDVQRKIVYIEPFNDFFTHTDGVDWTQKIDFSKTITDKYDIGLTQEIVFQYKEDSKDKYLESLNTDDNGQKKQNPLYSYYENLGFQFKKGKTKFENPLFTPTQQTWDNDVTNVTTGTLIPVIWGGVPPSLTIGYDSIATSPIERPDKIWDNEPRIAYYHGYTDNPNNSNYITKWNKSTGVSTIVWGVQEYPRATFVDWEDATFPSLSYSDETVIPPFTTATTNVEGLYNTYWGNMIEQLKTNPRIRNIYINLNIKDILNLDIRRLVYLDGSWWRINKIVDFSPAKSQTTKVELIQWFEV